MIVKFVRTLAGAALVGVLALTGTPPTFASVTSAPTQSSQVPGYEHHVDVVFIGSPDVALIDESVLTAAVERISDYWVTETEGHISKINPREILRVRVPDEEPLASEVCSNDGLRVREAVASLFNRTVASYNHSDGEHLLIIESTSACGHGVGGNATLGNKGLQSGGSIWVKLNPSAPLKWNHILFHEFGHNLGLDHSDELACTGGQIDTATIDAQGIPSSPECTVNEYHDAIDVMANRYEYQGYSKLEHVAALNVTHRIATGVFGDSDIARVSQDGGTAQFVPLQPSTDASGIRAVEVTDPVTGENYYLEYRAGQGRDAASYYASWPEEFSHIRELKPGVRVLRMHKRSGSVVLNRPGLSDEDAAQQGGNSYVTGDVFNGFSRQLRVEVMSMDAEIAGLCIAFTDDEVPAVTPGTPSLSEGDTVGTVLTADPGTWTPSSTDLTYQWIRDGVEIPGATDSTYELTQADLGSDISVRVGGSEICYEDQDAESSAVTVLPAVDEKEPDEGGDEGGEANGDPDPEPSEPVEEEPEPDTDADTTLDAGSADEQDDTDIDVPVKESLPHTPEDIGTLPSTGYGSLEMGVLTSVFALVSGIVMLVLRRRRKGHTIN